jgi:hypothetical protein
LPAAASRASSLASVSASKLLILPASAKDIDSIIYSRVIFFLVAYIY